MSHTKEPWNFRDSDFFGAEIECSEGGLVATAEIDEDAHRIVACVNACVRMSNEQLKLVAEFGGIQKSFDVIEKQRDELLAALEDLRSKLSELSQDATRYRWLRQQFCGVDFDWGFDEGDGKQVLMFNWPAGLPVGANCDKNIDLGITKTKGEP